MGVGHFIEPEFGHEGRERESGTNECAVIADHHRRKRRDRSTRIDYYKGSAAVVDWL